MAGVVPEDGLRLGGGGEEALGLVGAHGAVAAAVHEEERSPARRRAAFSGSATARASVANGVWVGRSPPAATTTARTCGSAAATSTPMKLPSE